MIDRRFGSFVVRSVFLAASACVCACGVLLHAEPAAAQPAERLRVSPADAVVAPGGSIRFDVDAEAGVAMETIAWRVIPATLGDIAPDGTFIAAERAGRGIVRAESRAGGAVRVGHALVRVSDTPDSPRLRVTPATATLAPGDEIALRAEPEAGGALEAPVEWSVAPEGAGTITPEGRFVAGAEAGRARVLASSTLGGARVEGAARLWIGPRRGASPALTVAPAALALRPGERAQLEARLEPAGAESLLAAIRWSLFPPALGSITPGGAFEAGPTPGDGHAAASLEWEGEAIRAFARIRVLPAPGAAAMRIRPASALLVPGRPVRFEAFLLTAGDAGARARGGAAATGAAREPVDADWSLEPPSLGAISADGVLTPARDAGSPGGVSVLGDAASAGAGAPAQGFVVARAIVDGVALEARAAVRVAPGAVSDLLELRPRFITTRPGGEVRVDALLGGRPLPAIVPIRWTVTPPTIGTVTPDGLFTANASLATPASDDFGRREGVLIATASLPEGKLATGTARVVVLPADAPDAIRVIPAQATLGLSETVRFRVAPMLGSSGGGEARIGGASSAAALEEPRVVWSVVPARLGTITPDGLFTPNPRLPFLEGGGSLARVDGRVVAEVRVSPTAVVRGDARVSIVLPPAGGSQLAIEPPTADLISTEAVRFIAKIDGSDASGFPGAAWSVVPRTLGTITAAGVFKPSPEPPLVGEPRRQGEVRFAIGQGPVRLEASAAVMVRY